MKTLADFRKTVETGVDSRLKPVTYLVSALTGSATLSPPTHCMNFITIGRSCPNLHDTIQIESFSLTLGSLGMNVKLNVFFFGNAVYFFLNNRRAVFN